jgi:hypothetical protein
MEDRQSRFRCQPEPQGIWTVWDDRTDAPATLRGHALIGRTWERAKAGRDLLRRIYEDARPVRRIARPSIPAPHRVDELISSIRNAGVAEEKLRKEEITPARHVSARRGADGPARKS